MPSSTKTLKLFESKLKFGFQNIGICFPFSEHRFYKYLQSFTFHEISEKRRLFGVNSILHSWFLSAVNFFHSWFLSAVNFFHSWFLSAVNFFHSWFLLAVNFFLAFVVSFSCKLLSCIHGFFQL